MGSRVDVLAWVLGCLGAWVLYGTQAPKFRLKSDFLSRCGTEDTAVVALCRVYCGSCTCTVVFCLMDEGLDMLNFRELPAVIL
jgi:hypothetical protein